MLLIALCETTILLMVFAGSALVKNAGSLPLSAKVTCAACASTFSSLQTAPGLFEPAGALGSVGVEIAAFIHKKLAGIMVLAVVASSGIWKPMIPDWRKKFVLSTTC